MEEPSAAEHSDPPGGNWQDALLFSTLRLETTREDGRSLQATAFIYEYRAEDGDRYPFLVTARHAVVGAVEGRITFIPEQRGRPDLSKGYTLDIENFAKLWYPHPDAALDVAVTPFVPFVRHIEDSGIPLYYCTLHLVSEEVLAQPLAPLILSAHPSGVSGPDELLPQVLQGRLSGPRLGLYAGRERFLVALGAFPGAAGAPLFVPRTTDVALVGMLVEGQRLDAAVGERALVPLHEAFSGPVGPLAGALRARVFVSLIRGYLKEKGFI